MAPRRTKLVQNDYKKLREEDVICPICGTVLIKPITLPCRHGFCSSCFEAATENANVACPKCRVRVGSFLRSATKSNKLINEALWKAIQDAFPVQVKNKLNEIGRNYGGTCKMKPANEKNNRRVDDNVKKNAMQKIKANSVSTDSRSNERPNFVNNLATKEYTCRVLCQKETKPLFKESQIALQKKNKRIQEIMQSEMSANDRSNSIESECLYFKPIDYRHNPPSEGLAPIKVPTRKPNVSPHTKILAPSGQNQINMHHLESAFARLCSFPLEKEANSKKENVEVQLEEEEEEIVTPLKRKQHDKSENKAKKRARVTHNSTNNQKESVAVSNVCDSRRCKAADVDISIDSVSVKKLNFKQQHLNEQFKKALQEKADFELATKLQQTFNQSYKYSTRSAIKMATAAEPVNIGNMMTSYKVN